MATISVSMVVRPPGPQPTHGLPRCTVVGPFSVRLSLPAPVMSTVMLAPEAKVSAPAGGNVHGAGVGEGVLVGVARSWLMEPTTCPAELYNGRLNWLVVMSVTPVGGMQLSTDC